MDGIAPFRHHASLVFQNMVFDADIGEGAAHHHLVIATTCAILVKVGRSHFVVDQIFACRRSRLDRTGRRNMVGGDLVAEQGQNPCAGNIGDRLGLMGDAVEIRRVLHIGRPIVPCIGFTSRCFHTTPVHVTGKHIRIAGLVNLLGDIVMDIGLDLFRGRPDIFQINRHAAFADAERLARQILGHRTRQRISDDEGRRREIIGLHVGRDTPFEIAVPRQYGRRHNALVIDGFGNLDRQRAGIADTGRATETDKIEAQFVEIFLQAGIGQIFRNHLRTGCQRGLHPWLHFQTGCGGIAGQKTGTDQHRRVGGVGARRDGCNHHIAMAEVEVFAFNGKALTGTGGLFIFGLHRRGKTCGNIGQRHAPFRTLGTGHRGHHFAQIKLERIGEDRIRRCLGAEQTLCLGVFFNELHAGGFAA